MSDLAVIEPKRGRGAPSTYTQELAEKVLGELYDGKTLTAVCAQEDMPARQTVLLWTENHPDFMVAYARARIHGFDRMAEDIIKIADGSTPQMANVDKLRVDARKWLLAKLRPSVYGEQLTLNGGESPLKIEVDDRELARRVALLLSRTIDAQADVSDCTEVNDEQPVTVPEAHNVLAQQLSL